jgi:hypothetical protein
MEAKNKNVKSKSFYDIFTENAHWIATIFLILGFIIMSINDKAVFGKSFHQLILAPILLLVGYCLFIFVVMKKIRD